MSNINNHSLDIVANNLGLEEAVEMFEYALPHISQRRDELRKHISISDWEAAGQCVHRTLSSVNLYGSDRLEELLLQVKLASTGEVEPSTLNQELSKEFDNVLQSIKQWLATHTSS
ncbi:MAG: Unknown protein [uncultured Thiotrichaceae bacterium]|uniref:HPt domain-containing protein n=1 Tax=uncultured Thiotrichaceae bacterium TaxID=298394 RepID=A0A6S6U973_9GAMM|nr:MAG: Unknown protein [uncultured Thiotrichaceae bacterium]